jgi:hypothetical protein
VTTFKAGVVTTPDVQTLRFSPTSGADVLTIDADGKGATLTLTGGISTASLDFTDGDTAKRFTVTDANVGATNVIQCSIRRADIADVDDPGWIYVPNVVKVAAGSFDVLVVAFMRDGLPGVNEFPNETVVLSYSIQ